MAVLSSSSLPNTLTADTFTMPSNFRKAHCLADGQLTPPESPDAPTRPMLRSGPRLQLNLPKVLRRTKTENNLPAPPPVRKNSPVLRPFVEGMKAPFHLHLPDSPTDSDCSSFSSTSPTSAPELRRRSPTYHDLRSLATKHRELVSNKFETPLLPSPIDKDERIQSDSYFTFRNPRRTPPTQNTTYQSPRFLSYYCDDNSKADRRPPTSAPAPEAADAELPDVPSPMEDSDSISISSIDTPTTPEEQIFRTDTISSNESGWLANDTSFPERQSRFKARCFQVFSKAPTEANKQDDEVTIVTMAGPGKPKLVQISRPSSMSVGTDSCRHSLITRPQTPPRTTEVSAFSPYDTPCSPTPPRATEDHFATDRRPSATAPVDKHRFSTYSLMPAPLSTRISLPPQPPSNNSTSTVFTSTLDHLTHLSDPFAISGTSQHTLSTSSIPNLSTTTISTAAWPIPPKSTLRHTTHASTSALTSLAHRLHHLRTTLQTISHAIELFPKSIIRLSSPSLQSLRASHIPDTYHLDPLSKIFPRAPSALLSALAAWLLIDAWIERTILAAPPHVREAELTAEDVLHSQHATSFWTAPHCSHDASGRNDGEEVWQRANSPLKRIPTKARSLLGIGLESTIGRLEDERAMKMQEAMLIRRLRVVRPSVNVVGRKLVVALRGGWDEDVWRCLRVMVEVVEGSPVGCGGGGGEAVGLGLRA